MFLLVLNIIPQMEEYTIIKAKNLKELRSRLNNTKGIIVVEGGDEHINRFALEDARISILLNPENNPGMDFMHARNSGLNHVLCIIAAKNNKTIGINFNSLLEMSERNRIISLGRISQNIRLCRKYNVNIVMTNIISKWQDERSAKDLKTLCTILGLNIKEENIIKIKI